MANDRRVARVNSTLEREISKILLEDIKDERVGAGMVSITGVKVSNDLQHAKVFVSIYGTEEARAATMEGLHSATPYVRRELGSRVRLRRTPEVIFLEDRSIERGMQTLGVLERLREEREARESEDEA